MSEQKQRMSSAEYEATQQNLVFIAHLINQCDLHGFLESIEIAESVGPILDPTLYRKFMKKLESVKRLAQAALHFQNEVRRQMREEEEANGK